MKSIILILLCSILPFSFLSAQVAKQYDLKSPGGNIHLRVNTGSHVSWSVNLGDTEMILPSEISITLDDGTVLGNNVKVKQAASTSADETFNTPFL